MSAEVRTLDAGTMESLVLRGDLRSLSPQQKVEYYAYRCNQAGLDPAAKPFDLLVLNGKEILYANASCTQQLTSIHKLSHQITSRDLMEGIYCVGCRVTGPDGRVTENMGAVPLETLKGEARANAMLKATTKAIRRTVLAHCGLGMMDETEVETIPGAKTITIPATPGDPYSRPVDVTITPVEPLEWTDEQRTEAKAQIADLAEILYNAGYDEDNPKHQSTIKRYRDEIGTGTFENWLNRVGGAASRIKENPAPKPVDPTPVPPAPMNSDDSSISLDEEEMRQLEYRVANGWDKLHRKWDLEGKKRLAEPHRANRRTQRITEWAPGLERGTAEWLTLVAEGQAKELANVP